MAVSASDAVMGQFARHVCDGHFHRGDSSRRGFSRKPVKSMVFHRQSKNAPARWWIVPYRDLFLSFGDSHLGGDRVAGKQFIYHIEDPRISVCQLPSAGNMDLHPDAPAGHRRFCPRRFQGILDAHTAYCRIYRAFPVHQPDDPALCHRGGTHRRKDNLRMDTAGISPKPPPAYRGKHRKDKFNFQWSDLGRCYRSRHRQSARLRQNH